MIVMPHHDAGQALAKALGLPKNTTRAVIMVEPGSILKLEITTAMVEEQVLNLTTVLNEFLLIPKVQEQTIQEHISESVRSLKAWIRHYGETK